jgi:hypothetical protein
MSCGNYHKGMDLDPEFPKAIPPEGLPAPCLPPLWMPCQPYRVGDKLEIFGKPHVVTRTCKE